jgi:hypothetical protein
MGTFFLLYLIVILYFNRLTYTFIPASVFHILFSSPLSNSPSFNWVEVKILDIFREKCDEKVLDLFIANVCGMVWVDKLKLIQIEF